MKGRRGEEGGRKGCMKGRRGEREEEEWIYKSDAGFSVALKL